MSAVPVYTRRELQSLFARLLAQLILWIYARGWEVTLAEGYVGDTDGKDFDYDGPHMRAGAHYMRTGQDLNLWVRGEWKRDICPEWDEVGAKWVSMHPLCRWGGNFRSKDANHVSVLCEGRQ